MADSQHTPAAAALHVKLKAIKGSKKEQDVLHCIKMKLSPAFLNHQGMVLLFQVLDN